MGGRELTLREAQIVALIALGKTDREIATVLNMVYGTVKSHLKYIYNKTGSNNRTQVAVWATKRQGSNSLVENELRKKIKEQEKDIELLKESNRHLKVTVEHWKRRAT